MDEKTEELRDIFMDVAGEATVTEHQEEDRGSLAADGKDVAEQLRSTIGEMRERYEFRTPLADDDLRRIVEGFFAGESDAEIASDLGDEPSPETVARARVDLHLVTDRDLDAPFDLDVLRDALADDRPVGAIAEDLGVEESAVRRYRRIVEAQRERRVVGDRFREEFERILGDRALEERLTAEIKQTGLEDATEGMETNVSF